MKSRIFPLAIFLLWLSSFSSRITATEPSSSEKSNILQNQVSNFHLLNIPEPSTYALIGLGLGSLVVLRRMKKSVKA